MNKRLHEHTSLQFIEQDWQIIWNLVTLRITRFEATTKWAWQAFHCLNGGDVKVRIHRYICLKGHLSGSLAKVWNHAWLTKRNRSWRKHELDVRGRRRYIHLCDIAHTCNPCLGWYHDSSWCLLPLPVRRKRRLSNALISWMSEKGLNY